MGNGDIGKGGGAVQSLRPASRRTKAALRKSACREANAALFGEVDFTVRDRRRSLARGSRP